MFEDLEDIRRKNDRRTEEEFMAIAGRIRRTVDRDVVSYESYFMARGTYVLRNWTPEKGRQYREEERYADQ